jgi:Family of unknown function (DUF6361)
MASTLSWLDYSDAERRAALDVIELFRDRDTRDELGLGALRDGFADHFFPGTSTIQTRVAYFLLIPWLYERLERQHTGKPNVAERARRAELDLIEALLDDDDRDGVGVIGARARRSLKRLPSDVYWQGLGAWGIRVYPGGREQYLRRLARLRSEQRVEVDDDGEPLADAAATQHWHRGLPDPPAGFPDEASLRLRPEDRAYLVERILLERPRGTLLAWLVEHAGVSDVEFPWEHPEHARFPNKNRHELAHARMLSAVVHGAALLYNLLLARRRAWPEKIEEFEQRLGDWARTLHHDAGGDPGSWDLADFWCAVERTTAAVTLPTRAFVESWTRLVVEERNLGGSDAARDLIERRERQIKGAAGARLHNESALRLWGGDAGTARMSYRWPVTQRFVNDLVATDARP